MIIRRQADMTGGRGVPAVSVRQPLATALVARPGPSEFPAWETDYRGPLLIHAAKRGPGDPPAGRSDSPAYGVLLGVVDLVDCVRTEREGSGPDEVAFVWVLANAWPLAAPIPYVGRLGLFDVSPAVLAGTLAPAASGRGLQTTPKHGPHGGDATGRDMPPGAPSRPRRSRGRR